MKSAPVLVVAALVGPLATPGRAEDKKIDCDTIVEKHVLALGDMLTAQKPRGECAQARWSIQFHEEKLRVFNAEPEECRRTDLGKKFVSTVKSVISQEQRTRKRCKRG